MDTFRIVYFWMVYYNSSLCGQDFRFPEMRQMQICRRGICYWNNNSDKNNNINFLWIFHPSHNRWSSIKSEWLTATLPSFPELFSVFKLVSAGLWPGWFQFFLKFQVSPICFLGSSKNVPRLFFKIVLQDWSKGSKYDWNHCHVVQLFQLSDTIQVLLSLSF